MHASILIVGHPFPEKVEFGADHSSNYDQALGILTENKYAVIVAADHLPSSPSTLVKNSFEFLMSSRKLNTDAQIILVSATASPEELQASYQCGRNF